jgi:hypothetical protein
MYGSHGHYWIPEGMPHAGNIMFFNNGSDRPAGDFSTIEMLVPEENADGSYALDNNRFYGPREADLVYQAPSPFDFHSTFLSNAQALDNGNFFINEGGTGRLFEVTPDGEIVWQYETPIDGSGPIIQGENASGNSNFRAYKFSPNYGAFVGRDLTPGELLEGSSEFELCSSHTSEINQELEIDLRYNMVEKSLSIQNTQQDDLEISVYSIMGQRIQSNRKSSATIELSFNNLPSGAYLIILENQDGQNKLKKFIIPE